MFDRRISSIHRRRRNKVEGIRGPHAISGFCIACSQPYQPARWDTSLVSEYHVRLTRGVNQAYCCVKVCVCVAPYETCHGEHRCFRETLLLFLASRSITRWATALHTCTKMRHCRYMLTFRRFWFEVSNA